MIKKCLAGLCLSLAAYGAETESTFENSNFTLNMPINGTGEHEWYNYNRFRITENIRENNWFVTAIGDLQNHLGNAVIHSTSFQISDSVRSDTPFATRSKTYDYTEGELNGRIYRLYGGYADERHRLSFGLQKMSMGVGRIWNPTDLFNAKNPLALEPDEVNGMFSLAYTYSPGDLSQMTAVVAQRSDDSFKYAGRIKGYLLDIADAAIDAVSADDVGMIGYELEGELMKTGIELRSEGGWFDDKLLHQQFFQGLIGADYTFENSFSVALEWLHTSKTFERELLLRLPSGTPDNLVRAHDYGGINCGYEFDPLLYGSFSAIVNTEDGSFFWSPSLTYSLDNDSSLKLGGLLYGGGDRSEFGNYGQTYYVNIKITF
ncbi:hypothetical protein [Sulfuricurvum sp.]|uniref:hypothetical protein n=1 Tax=Sulfuricurvum sp. TaxID=2025608 RepID=UPI003BB154DC